MREKKGVSGRKWEEADEESNEATGETCDWGAETGQVCFGDLPGVLWPGGRGIKFL